MANPLAIGTAFLEMTARLMSDPSRLVQAQLCRRRASRERWSSSTFDKLPLQSLILGMAPSIARTLPAQAGSGATE